MSIIITMKAASESWWATCGRLVWSSLLSLTLIPCLDLLISVTIPIFYRTSKPYAQWEPPRFQEWKRPWEMAFLILTWVPITYVIFVWTFFDIAFRPTQQLHEIPADSPDTLKASHTQDRQISNISKQNIDNKDNEETAVDSEQNAGVQPSHNFNEERMSWGKETLTQLKVVFERECSTSPTILPTAATNTTKPFWVPSEKTRCLGPLDSHFPTANTYSPPMSLADTPSPSPSSQSTAHFEASQSEGESDFDAASAPICTPASVLSTSRPQPPGPSISTTSIAATPMPNSLFPGDDEALCKEKLFQEVTSWNYAPNEGTIKSHLIFQSENSERPFRIPSSEVLELELRRLEQMSARRMTIDVHPFRVYGTPELYEHDRLKCWVYLNQHLHGQLWPERYLAKTTKEELLETTENGFDDDEISVWSAATA